jgi:hypothetical protein
LLPKGAASQKDLDTAIAERGEARAAVEAEVVISVMRRSCRKGETQSGSALKTRRTPNFRSKLPA